MTATHHISTDVVGTMPEGVTDQITQRVRDETVIAGQLAQDWCGLCSHEEVPYHDLESGMPRDIVDVSVEENPMWDPDLGRGPRYEVVHMSCGHTLAQLC